MQRKIWVQCVHTWGKSNNASCWFDFFEAPIWWNRRYWVWFSFFPYKLFYNKRWYILVFVNVIIKVLKITKSNEDIYKEFFYEKTDEDRFDFPSEVLNFLISKETLSEENIQFIQICISEGIIFEAWRDESRKLSTIVWKTFSGQHSWPYQVKTPFKVSYIFAGIKSFSSLDEL